MTATFKIVTSKLNFKVLYKNILKFYLPCQMKGADFPVCIDPNDHLAHHNILLKPPGFTNCQCLRTSNHLNIIKGTKGIIEETNSILRGKADLKHCKGCCDGVVVNCQRNWVALMNWVHSYQVSLFTEKLRFF